MTAPLTSSHSLRRRLLGWVMTVIVLAALFQAASAYRSALRQADAMFDYHLQQMAFALRGGPPLAVPMLEGDPNGDVDYVIQIWGPDGSKLFQSNRFALPGRAVLGFSDMQQDGRRFRVYSLQTAFQTIQIAQDMDGRGARARALALRAALPMAAVAPLLMLCLWWVIRHSLAPIERTRQHVARRAMDDLAPLPEDGLPDEVRPLVQEINLLFGRLHTAFDAQRAFVSNAAHELRSPLTALKLQAQVLGRPMEPQAREQALARLNLGMDRAIRLMNQLLVLARQEGSPDDPSHAPRHVDLRELVQQAVTEVYATAREHGQDLGVADAGDIDDADRTPVPAPVLGDPDALGILLRNLLDNAIKYTPDGGRIDLRVRTEADGAVQLQVEDSGPGIPEQDRARMFERFARGEHPQASGSGLGLAIVRTIAERHDAQLELASSPTLGGLQVNVRFPAAPLDDGGATRA